MVLSMDVCLLKVSPSKPAFAQYFVTIKFWFWALDRMPVAMSQLQWCHIMVLLSMLFLVDFFGVREWFHWNDFGSTSWCALKSIPLKTLAKTMERVTSYVRPVSGAPHWALEWSGSCVNEDWQLKVCSTFSAIKSTWPIGLEVCSY